MKVRVAAVVPLLVVDCGHIARDTTCQPLRECCCECLALLVSGFDWQGDDEPLTCAPFTLLCGVLCGLRGFYVCRSSQAFAQNQPRCVGPRDVAQMRGGLPNLRNTVFGGSLVGECLDRMP